MRISDWSSDVCSADRAKEHRMNTETSTLSGPDLTLGIPLSTLPEGAMLQGHAGGEAVLLVRRAGRLFAVGAFCTHYGAPLVGGLVVEETIRCPWHQDRKSVR